jgi:hypothetical protein
MADNGELITLLPDIPPGSQQSPSGTVFAPYSWSPNGTSLLISISLSDEITLGIVDISSGVLTILPAACCQAVWMPDGLSILVSNPYGNNGSPGLWVFPVDQSLPASIYDAPGPDGRLPEIGWPLPLDNGEVLAFSRTGSTNSNNARLFQIVHISATSNFSLTSLRSDSFQVKEALWAADASFVVAVINPPAEETWSPAGPVILIPADNRPVIPLAASGYYLHWGP